MKRCGYCGRENSDEVVHYRECGSELEGTDEVTTTTEEKPSDSEAGLFVKTTDLPLADAEKFLDRLESEGIQFKLAPLDPTMGEMDAFTASIGGSFGTATSVRIFTRLDDDVRVEKVWREFCGFES